MDFSLLPRASRHHRLRCRRMAPEQGEIDRYGRVVPDTEYHTPDFERLVAIRARTRAIARHLAGFMRQTNRFAKTIVFCVDQEHALEMRGALAELTPI